MPLVRWKEYKVGKAGPGKIPGWGLGGRELIGPAGRDGKVDPANESGVKDWA